MEAIDFITRARIQKRVESLVQENMDDNGFVPFSLISEKIASEFSEYGDNALEEAKKQYDFMYEW